MPLARILSAAPILALGATLACTDAAPTAPPSLARGFIPQHNTYHDVIPVSFSCGAFHVGGTLVLDARETLIFDESGSLVRSVLHIQRHAVLTNHSTGETLNDEGSGNVMIDYVAGTVARVGKYFLVTGDTRARDVGRLVTDLGTGAVYFSAGPRDAGASQDQVPLICAELAP